MVPGSRGPPTVRSAGTAVDASTRTLMSDPDDPRPWDEVGPPTVDPGTTLDGFPDTVARTDPGSSVIASSEEVLVSDEIEPFDETDDGRRRGMYVGFVAGALVGLVLVAVYFWWMTA